MSDKVSVIIPARNEPFLQKTIECVFASAVEDVEVVAICDGYWPDPPIQDHANVVIIHHTTPIGQRASVNEGAKIASGKWIMKLDAHCNLAKGFDKALKEACQYEWTMVPRMYNMEIKTFQPKHRRYTDYMYISGPHYEKPFRAMYFDSRRTNLRKKNKIIDETMACMGPGWFLHKDRFWEQEGCDEEHGGWGQMGVEVSLKAWLSGGALMVHKGTWFAHWFRGGGVPVGFKSGFPYHLSQRDVDKARSHSQSLWLGNKWCKQVRPIEWLVEKFDAPTWKRDLDLSVIIPSYKDPLLHKTIQGILDNFETDFEIIPVLDGYKPDQPIIEHERVKPVYLEHNVGMRGAINAGVRIALGNYIMRTDEHVMFCKGYDKTLLQDIKDDQIVVGKRYFLDPVKWEIMQEEGCIEYEKLIINNTPKKFSSQKWITRSREKADVMIDENMAMQGSVWLMSRFWWNKVIKELQTEGYGPHYQDSTEMLFKTWKAGGKLMLNKNAWYAHKHRGFPRTHHYSNEKARLEWIYALNKWFPKYQEIRTAWGI